MIVHRQDGKSTHSETTSEVQEDIHLDGLIHLLCVDSLCGACREVDVDNSEEKTSW